MPPKAAPPASSASAVNAFNTLWKAYHQNTSDRLKFIDSFLVFLMLSGVVQFVYCILVSNFPYNAFLAGYVLEMPLLSYMLLLTLDCPVDSQVPLDSSSWQRHCVRKSTPIIKMNSKTYRRKGVYIFCEYNHISLTYSIRAFADFALGSIVLHFFVYNFLG